MPRAKHAAPPDRAALAATPLHVVVRDFPETLAVLRRRGVDVPHLGGLPLSRAGGHDAGAVLDAVADAIVWRAEDAARPGR